MRPSSKIFHFALLVILLCTTAAFPSDSLQPKSVLLLFSLEPGLPAYDLIYANLRATLDNQANESINYYIEYLDCSRFPDEEYQKQLFDLYTKKYSTKKIDVCLAVTQGIESMLAKYGKELFDGVPTIFIELPSIPGQAPPYFRRPNTTGILMDLDLKKNLETALSLYPDAANVYLVTGTSRADQFFAELARNAFRPREDTIKISYLQGLTMNELLQTVGRLPKNSLIIYLSYLRDADGRVYYPAHGLKLISDNATVPVFGMFDTYIGYGIVGGYMVSFERVGVEAGKMVLRVLRGEPPETIPVVNQGTSLFMFDWRQLQRWKISENRLPENSDVRFYTPTFWQSHRGYVLGALFICLLESFLIAGLLFQRRRKQLAIQELETQLRFEEMAGDISAHFINLPPDDIDDYLVESIGKIANFFGFDIAELGLFNGLTQKEIVSYLWFTDNISASYPGMTYENFPWILANINAGQSVCFQNNSELPAEAETDRKNCDTIPIKSSYALPLFSGRRRIGFFALSKCREPRKMTNKMLQRQKLIAEVLSNAVVRRDSWRALQESEAQMSMAASSAELALWVWDIRKDEIWVTAKGRSMFGFSDSEPVSSQRFIEAVAAEDRKSMRHFLDAALKSGSYYEIEHRIALPSGDIRWLVTRGQVDVDEHEIPLRIRGVSADISRRKKAEENAARLRNEMNRYSRINMLGGLSGSMAHELNQPLAAILSNAQAGLRFLHSGKASSELLGSIFQNIVEDDKRAAEVITSLRSMVKKEKVEKKPIHLNDIFSDVVKIYNSEAVALNLKLETDFAELLPPCMGDNVQLSQVVLNIVMNAADAMSRTLPENKKMILQTKMAGRGVCASVRDFGPGIDDSIINHIFELFFTTKNTGLGMGLALCKTIIQDHGGRIWAENNPDGGATFFFELPAIKND
jgi:PAS domain S-box-containing protein